MNDHPSCSRNPSEHSSILHLLFSHSLKPRLQTFRLTSAHTLSSDASHLFVTSSSVTLSAAWWTVKHNLVVMAGPDTSVYQLTQASHLISDTLSTFLSHDLLPLPVTSRENVKWSHLLINGIPTRVTSSCRPYTPSECQQALMADNPAFQTLCLTPILGEGTLNVFRGLCLLPCGCF